VSESQTIGCKYAQRCRVGLFILLPLIVVFATGARTEAQSLSVVTKPYATLDREGVTYRGPANTGDKELPADVAVIGMILPLHGTQAAEGRALLAAAQVALEEEQARGLLADGRKLALTVRDESGPWGQASSEILKLIEQDHAVAVLTSANGATAHQAEQIANKISFPILTLASDPITTQTNIPWVFRLGPSDADQARAFARRIYAELRLSRVLLVAQTDHDGRTGRAAFEKASRELKAPAPEVMQISASAPDFGPVSQKIQASEPDAVVVWTDGTTTEELISTIHKAKPLLPIFLSTKTAQLGSQNLSSSLCIAALTGDQRIGELFTVVNLPVHMDPARNQFERDYGVRTGSVPGIAAFEVDEAVRLIAAALRAAGTNRFSLRDYLASDGKFRGASAIAPFDPAGNNVEEFAIVIIAAPPTRQSAQQLRISPAKKSQEAFSLR
jgi:branched-chain amino acid transport system substrate-binding protein